MSSEREMLPGSSSTQSVRRTALSWQVGRRGSSPPSIAATLPPATERTSAVAIATLRRRARGRGSAVLLPPRSGKL
ncbi:hypothetical protein [Streptomyces sp. NPDC048825]|uniref:hypothetical protein n=1 Tax=Streptomyces sp. NPDC048825 TaxID=3365592 RepID=UPI0037226DB6